MAAYAAVTLFRPGTFLDALWTLNKRGHDGLLPFGRKAGLLFLLLSGMLAVAASGWSRRRLWGWTLGVTIISINAAGDLLNITLGERLKGAVGVVIAGSLLIYMTRPKVRAYFRP
jgi:hypothetical protein